MNTSIVIPVHREEKNIAKVLSQINSNVKTSHEIIVVYDSKTDPTVPIVENIIKKNKRTKIKLLQSNTENCRGVMNAIKTGFSVARGKAIVVVMADLADDVSQIDDMFDLVLEGNDVVCASRFMKGGKKIGGPILKTILSKIACFSLYHFFKVPTHDATNAFKMYKREIFKDIKIESTGGFEYSLEIVLKAFKLGYKITEIPTVWRDREEGKSNFKLLAWIPQYIKWYFSVLPEYFLAYLSLVAVSLFLGMLQLGNELRDKILISSTLDFSWVSDSIERFLHGYIAGKDFIFTYGPAFQFIYSFPAVIFHLPSYISAAYAPLIIIFLNSIAIISISKSLLEDKKKALGLSVVLLLLCNFISLNYSNSLFRVILPLLFASLWTGFVYKKESIFKIIIFASLPSVFGLYTYDIFLQCLIFLVLVYAYDFLKRKNVKNLILVVSASLTWQLFISFLVSGGLFYTKASLNTVSDYFFIMNTAWEFARSNYLYVYVILLIVFFIYLTKSKNVNGFNKKVLSGLFFMSLVGLRTAFIRSDTGHIELSIYESIFVLFAIMYIFAVSLKKNSFIFLSVFLLLFIPFRQNYYSVLSEKNLTKFFSVLIEKPQFLEIYKFPGDYYLSREEFNQISKFVSQNKDKVMVYPYDSFLLAVNNTTFNTTALQFYDYSNSFVEKESVKNLEKISPEYIILGIDKISAVELDDIPNFTRNPVLAKWMINNYVVYKKYSNFLILKFIYGKESNIQNCISYNLHADFTNSGNVFEKIMSLFKPEIFYLYDIENKTAVRLPVKKGISDFYLVRKGSDLNQMSFLIQGKNNDLEKITKEKIKIYKVNSLTKSKTEVTTENLDLKLDCIQ